MSKSRKTTFVVIPSSRTSVVSSRSKSLSPVQQSSFLTPGTEGLVNINVISTCSQDVGGVDRCKLLAHKLSTCPPTL